MEWDRFLPERSLRFPQPAVLVSLGEAAAVLPEAALAQRAREIVQEALSAQPNRILPLALRVGGLAAALHRERTLALDAANSRTDPGPTLPVNRARWDCGL